MPENLQQKFQMNIFKYKEIPYSPAVSHLKQNQKPIRRNSTPKFQHFAEFKLNCVICSSG